MRHSRWLSHGWIIIWSSLVLTLLIWVATLLDYRFIQKDPFLFISKMAALLGTVGMCWTFILSTRLYLFEIMFSGLDKVYHAHRVLGITSFSFICIHPICQVLRFIPHWEIGIRFFRHELGGITLGILAFALFLTLIALTLWIKIPYHIWKKTHEYFILVLLLVLFHTIWIDKQVHDSRLLAFWVYGFIALGLISYVYIRFLYWRVGPRYYYRIEHIERKGKLWDLYLTPIDRKMRYMPGQFIYISFDQPGIEEEAHPFSVSSSPDEELLRVSIKNLGDYTSRLGGLQTDSKAVIWGPYGKFYEKFLCGAQKDAVFISGGIGITPFLSMLRFEADHPKKRASHLFYCVKNEERAPYHEELFSLAKRSSSIHYIPWYADSQGFITVDALKERLDGSLKNKFFFICGPLPMMKALISQLNKQGVKNKNIIFEDFNLRD